MVWHLARFFCAGSRRLDQMSSFMRLAALTGGLVFDTVIAGIACKVERNAQLTIDRITRPARRENLIKVTRLVV
jgi:hypothetical protein